MLDAKVPSRRFAPGVAERLGFYVYLLVDPRTQRPFYVGKGVGDRCFAHLDEARRTAADGKGDYAKLATIREIEAVGLEVGIDILRHGMTEESAFAVESAAIDLLGVSGLANRVVGSGTAEVGRMSVADLTALYGARPVVIAPDEPVLLIRVSRVFQRGMSDADLYEATRAWWKVRIHRARRARWAFSVFGGVVRAVYRIDDWEQPTPEVIADDPIRQGRWAFIGERDHAMEKRYLYGNVVSYLPLAAQNPVRYVNC